MAIYTRFGSEIEITAARLAPVWIERLAGEIKHHYKPKQPTRRTKSLKEMPFWFVTATFKSPDGGMVCGGKWFNPMTLVADDGSREIMLKLHELAPDDRAKEEEWNRADGPQASELFPAIEDEMVA